MFVQRSGKLTLGHAIKGLSIKVSAEKEESYGAFDKTNKSLTYSLTLSFVMPVNTWRLFMTAAG